MPRFLPAHHVSSPGTKPPPRGRLARKAPVRPQLPGIFEDLVLCYLPGSLHQPIPVPLACENTMSATGGPTSPPRPASCDNASDLPCGSHQAETAGVVARAYCGLGQLEREGLSLGTDFKIVSQGHCSRAVPTFIQLLIRHLEASESGKAVKGAHGADLQGGGRETQKKPADAAHYQDSWDEERKRLKSGQEELVQDVLDRDFWVGILNQAPGKRLFTSKHKRVEIQIREVTGSDCNSTPCLFALAATVYRYCGEKDRHQEILRNKDGDSILEELCKLTEPDGTRTYPWPWEVFSRDHEQNRER